MAEYYFSKNIGNNRTLCISPLTDRLIAESGQEVSDPGGYFLFERYRSDGPNHVEIIAQALSEEAAFRLRAILEMACPCIPWLALPCLQPVSAPQPTK